eukprot:COSAG02_NODE_3835_length_6173_cov_2.602898_3_plen_691_part_00
MKRRAPDTVAEPQLGSKKHPTRAESTATSDGAINAAHTGQLRADLDTSLTDSLAWRHCSEWIVANGGAVTSLTIETDIDGLRGLHATQPIPRGTPVLRVPRRCVLTIAKVLASPVGTALGRLQKETLQHAPSDVILALFLILDRSNKSGFFAPYHATLPSCSDASSVSALPANWQTDELERLRGSKLFADVERQREAIFADHALIMHCWTQIFKDPDVPAPSLEDFRWGMAMVSSRGFELDWSGEDLRHDDEERTAKSDSTQERDQKHTASKPRLGEMATGIVGMVPIFDLGNHKRPRDVSYSSSDETISSSISDGTALPAGKFDCDYEVVVTTLRDIDAGEHVCMTYGAQPNAKLLQDYGFVTLPNIEPDGSSNDTLKLFLRRSESADDVGEPAVVEVELRMAVETSYTYFPFLTAIDAYAVQVDQCTIVAGPDPHPKTQADGDTGIPGDFEAFEAAMAAIDGDGDIDEDDGEDCDCDLDDEATDELYGGECVGQDGGSPATTTAAAGDATAFVGGEDETAAARVASALPKLIAKLQALQAGYHTVTSVDGAKSQLFQAHASEQVWRKGQHDDVAVSRFSAASRAAVAAAVIVLVEQCTLEFFITAAKKALLVLVHDDPCDAMIALRNRAEQEQQQQQQEEADEETSPHHSNSMEHQVRQLCRLCRGVGSTRLALALLQLRCGMGSPHE